MVIRMGLRCEACLITFDTEIKKARSFETSSSLSATIPYLKSVLSGLIMQSQKSWQTVVSVEAREEAGDTELQLHTDGCMTANKECI
jgi:hypothetical protein